MVFCDKKAFERFCVFPEKNDDPMVTGLFVQLGDYKGILIVISTYTS